MEKYKFISFIKVKYPLLLGAILAASVCLSLVFWYNKDFGARYMDLMAETSMKDDTNSLTSKDRKELREIMNNLFYDMGLRVSFHIAKEKAMPETVGENTLRIAINTNTNDIYYGFPIRLQKALGSEQKIVKEQMKLNFELCTQRFEKPLGTCIQENLVFAKNEIYMKRAIVLKLK